MDDVICGMVGQIPKLAFFSCFFAPKPKLTNCSSVIKTEHTRMSCSTFFIGYSGSLIFLSISTNDSGNYTCEAVNIKLRVGETGSLHEVNVTTSGRLCGSEIRKIYFWLCVNVKQNGWLPMVAIFHMLQITAGYNTVPVWLFYLIK